MDYIIARLLEASTLRGLVLLIGGLAGLDVSDTDAEQIVTGALTLAGLLGAALPDRIGRHG